MPTEPNRGLRTFPTCSHVIFISLLAFRVSIQISPCKIGVSLVLRKFPPQYEQRGVPAVPRVALCRAATLPFFHQFSLTSLDLLGVPFKQKPTKIITVFRSEVVSVGLFASPLPRPFPSPGSLPPFFPTVKCSSWLEHKVESGNDSFPPLADSVFFFPRRCHAPPTHQNTTSRTLFTNEKVAT